MRTKIFILFASALSLCASCSKDDKVDLDKIAGSWTWDTTYPDPIMDVGVTYEFMEDGRYVKHVYGMDIDGSTVTEGKYVTSIIGKPRLLTLYIGETVSEQYSIKKLTSGQMLLENTADDGYPEVMKLLRTEFVLY